MPDVSGIIDAVRISNFDETYYVDGNYIFKLDTEKRLLISASRYSDE
ncbi:MAG: hypothetical protein FWD28_01005 [Treponema sp.]|nr:hypothetical protein [Treponema sp.]